VTDDQNGYHHYGGIPPHQRGETSREAAQAILPRTGTLRRRVYDWWYAQLEGGTDDEAQVALEMDPSTERPRRIELTQDGLLVETNLTRPTRSGRRARVYVCAEFVEVLAPAPEPVPAGPLVQTGLFDQDEDANPW